MHEHPVEGGFSPPRHITGTEHGPAITVQCRDPRSDMAVDTEGHLASNLRAQELPPVAAAKPADTEAKASVMDFDDMLPYVGEFGIYQKLLFLMMIPFAFFVSFVYFAQIFITVVPESHWCSVPELNHLPLQHR